LQAVGGDLTAWRLSFSDEKRVRGAYTRNVLYKSVLRSQGSGLLLGDGTPNEPKSVCGQAPPGRDVIRHFILLRLPGPFGIITDVVAYRRQQSCAIAKMTAEKCGKVSGLPDYMPTATLLKIFHGLLF